MNGFDVRVHTIRRRPDRRRPFEVRWHAADRARSRSFITRRLADSYRAELVRAGNSVHVCKTSTPTASTATTPW